MKRDRERNNATFAGEARFQKPASNPIHASSPNSHRATCFQMYWTPVSQIIPSVATRYGSLPIPYNAENRFGLPTYHEKAVCPARRSQSQRVTAALGRRSISSRNRGATDPPRRN